MRKYHVVGYKYFLNPPFALIRLHGLVIASPDAFYFSTTGVEFSLWLILWRWLYRLWCGKEFMSERIDYNALPAEVIHHPDWPLKAGTSMLIVPRHCVKHIHVGFWRTYDLVCDYRTYRISPFPSDMDWEFLRAAGWNEKLDRQGPIKVEPPTRTHGDFWRG
jgi:hypothetical protein